MLVVSQTNMGHYHQIMESLFNKSAKLYWQYSVLLTALCLLQTDILYGYLGKKSVMISLSKTLTVHDCVMKDSPMGIMVL